LGLVCLMLFLRQTKSLEQAQLSYAADLSVEKNRLQREILLRTGELTNLAKYLQTIREDEKSNLARELHDELGALLTAAKLDIARLKRSLGELSPDAQARMNHLGATINAGIGLKRRIIEDLRPSSLSNLGLLAALEIQVQEFEERSGLQIVADLQAVTVPAQADIVIYRFVQEALTNIVKHAKATQVAVTLKEVDKQVYLAVIDNGVGMAQAQAKKQSVHGLLGMRYRIEALSGRMSVSPSLFGKGLRLEAWLPIDRSSQDTPSMHTDDEEMG
jgi:signal transduction histidine kinase